MIFKNKLILILGSLVLIIGLLLFFFIGESSNQSDIVYMDNFRVFENFQLKKDYDKLLEKELIQESQSVDSMGMSLTKLIEQGKLSEEEVNNRKASYFEIQKNLEGKFETLSKDYTAKVYERLNEYIKTFGKENKYKLILGANGQGNVMYSDEQIDITDDLIEFINKKYLDN
jgi:outer membrane protein